VVSEVLKTRSVRVQLHQGPARAGKLIVEFADMTARDAIVAAIQESCGRAIRLPAEGVTRWLRRQLTGSEARREGLINRYRIRYSDVPAA